MTARDLNAAGGLGGGRTTPVRPAEAGPLDGCTFTGRELALSATPKPARFVGGIAGPDGSLIGLMPAAETGLVVGPSGCGKSSLTLGYALGVAAGVRALGCVEVPATGGAVYYVTAEDQRDVVARRVRAYLGTYLKAGAEQATMVAGLDRLHVASRPKGRSWSLIDRHGGSTPVGRALDEWIRAGGRPVSLVVFDTLASLGNDEIEKSPTAAREFLEGLDAYSALPGDPAVVLIHHSRKLPKKERPKATPKGRPAPPSMADEDEDEMEADDVRGTGAIVGTPRFTLAVSPKKHGVRLHTIKSNRGAKGAGVNLGLQIVDGEPVFWSRP